MNENRFSVYEPLYHLKLSASDNEIDLKYNEKNLNDVFYRFKNIFNAVFLQLAEIFGSSINFDLNFNKNSVRNLDIHMEFSNDFLQNESDENKMYVYFSNITLIIAKWFIESTKLNIQVHRINVDEGEISINFNLLEKNKNSHVGRINSFFDNHNMDYKILNITGNKLEKRLLREIMLERPMICSHSVELIEQIPEALSFITPNMFIANTEKDNNKNYLMDKLLIPGIILYGECSNKIHKSIAHKVNLIPLLELVENSILNPAENLNTITINFSYD